MVGEAVPKDRKFEENWAIVRKGDKIHVRVKEQIITFDSKEKQK